ncbi:MAG: hypothetical protein ABW252_09385 [Polyangiales bacterium]
MSSGRLAAKVLFFLACGFASACADASGADEAADVATEEAEVESEPLAQVGGGCLESVSNFNGAGPFRYTTRTSGATKLWVPQVSAGCKVPIVHLANGTGANCGNYRGVLERLASHGFLTVCYENTNTGAGQMGIDAIETAMRLYPDLYDNKIGSTGHSQGGQASLVTLQLAEQKWGSSFTFAGLAMEPASGFGQQPRGQSWRQSYGKIKSPSFLFSGDSALGFANSTLLGQSTGDGLVAISWVDEGYNALSRGIEAYHWVAKGASHIPTPQVETNDVAPAWFHWKLLGNNAACQYFKNLPNTGRWINRKQQNPGGC